MTEITLAIEASNPSSGGSGVALGEGLIPGTARVLGVEPLRGSDRRDDDLVPAIDRLARHAGIRPRDIARVACSIGPGGYTGVRIAVATAKLIAESVGAPCVGVPTARVVARRVDPGGRAFGVALAAKHNSVFLALFDAAGRETDPGGLVRDADLERSGIGLLIADRFLPDGFRAVAVRAGIEVREPAFDVAACFEVSLGLPAVDAGLLAPLYPREPDAVTQWRERKKGGDGRPTRAKR